MYSNRRSCSCRIFHYRSFSPLFIRAAVRPMVRTDTARIEAHSAWVFPLASSFRSRARAFLSNFPGRPPRLPQDRSSALLWALALAIPPHAGHLSDSHRLFAHVPEPPLCSDPLLLSSGSLGIKLVGDSPNPAPAKAELLSENHEEVLFCDDRNVCFACWQKLLSALPTTRVVRVHWQSFAMPRASGNGGAKLDPVV